MPTKRAVKKSPHKWSAAVTTDSTHPEHDLFNQDAQTVADSLFSKKVSPKGPASGMRMLNFYINRAGKNLSEERVATLNHAKQILSKKIAETKPAKKAAKKTPSRASN
jgi:tRNA(adenine34) deaminase